MERSVIANVSCRRIQPQGGLIEAAANNTMTAANATTFKLSDLDSVCRCEELGTMTLGQMLDGVDPDLIPSDQTIYEDLP